MPTRKLKERTVDVSSEIYKNSTMKLKKLYSNTDDDCPNCGRSRFFSIWENRWLVCECRFMIMRKGSKR